MSPMRIDYHDVYESQFEELIWALCCWLLGPGVQRFSSGRDSGRDARFRGTAQMFPSSSAPAAGRFIVQAKHTENPIAKVSDPDFSGTSESSVVSKEIPRIKALREAAELDHYILYTNRRAGADASVEVERRIQTETGLDSVALYGIETMDGHLRAYPAALDIANFRDYVGPLRVVADDLAEIINALKIEMSALCDAPPASLDRVAFGEKNERNKLSPTMASLIVGHPNGYLVALFELLPDTRRGRCDGLYADARDRATATSRGERDC
jgi:hypothetical protein